MKTQSPHKKYKHAMRIIGVPTGRVKSRTIRLTPAPLAPPTAPGLGVFAAMLAVAALRGRR